MSEARKSVHWACYALCLGALILLGLARSPGWQVKDPFGFLRFKVEAATQRGASNAGLPTGYIPMFGAFLICVLALWYHFAVARAVGLVNARNSEAYRFAIEGLESQLLVQSLQPPDSVREGSWAARLATCIT